MATNTYVALQTTTVGTATSTVTFNSIPQTYTDLILIANVKDANNYTILRVNNDSGSNYSRTVAYGNGSSAISFRTSNDTSWYAAGNDTNYELSIHHLQNYSNTTTNKTMLGRNGVANVNVAMGAYLWRNTAAINRIDIISASGSASITAGSTFTLYGVRAEGVSPAVKATGGAIYADSTYYYHVFSASGTFTPLSSLTADVLVVAGGGAGGYSRGGGGGAGGIFYATSQSLTATGYTCTVGGGGTAGSSIGSSTNGVDSTFGVLTAAKGGGKGGDANQNNAGTGGSGGGGAGSNNGTGGSSNQTSTGGTGYGFAGGSGGSGLGAASGGGAGAVGTSNGSNVYGATGAVGLATWSSWGIATGTGQNVDGVYYYGGGGAGGANASGTAVSGGSGGGGSASATGDAVGGNGSSFTGGGGSGGTNSTVGVRGGNGGSGLIIIRYLKA